MAKAQMLFPDDLTERLSKLGEKTGEIAEKVLEAGGKVACETVRDSLDSVVGKGEHSRSTGELQAALGVSPPKRDRDGNYNVKIGFAEPRSDGESNAKIANIIEHGKHGQPARPFLARAKRKLKKPVREAMIAKFNEEVGKL